MSRLTRAGLLALALPSLYAGMLLMPPQGAAAALLALKPGSIDHPLHLVGADFNLDGYDDLAIANFQAGTVTVLINQKNGTFLAQKDSPNIVGGATALQPTEGPLFLAVGDIDPEDVDGDRVTNDVDNCPNVFNPAGISGAQPDADSNGVGDACQTTTPSLDSDADGVPDYAAGILDNCPFIPNLAQQPETPQGLDGACDTPDDNFFLFGPDGLCGTTDDKPPNSKVGAACSRSPDLAVINASTGGTSTLGLVRVRVNDGAGGLKSRTSLQASSGASQAVLADLNGDHRLDLVVSNSGTDALLLYPGGDDGEMGFVCLGGSNAGKACVLASQCPGGTCQLTQALLAAGVCSGGSGSGQACATSNNCPGGGTCRLSTTPGLGATCGGGTSPGKTCTRDLDCPGGGICRSPAGPEGLAAADINGDDRPDLVFANRAAGTLGVLLNGGGAAFTPAPGSPFMTEDQPAAVLVAQGARICMGGTAPGTTCATDLDCGAGGVCRARSLDGDACADPVVLTQGPLICVGGSSAGMACATDRDCGGGGACRASHGKIQVFTATCPSGALVAGQSIDLGTGHAPRGGVLVDFDRDGNLDLAVADFTGGQVLIYAGSTTGLFTPTATLPGLASPSAIAPLNFDPDTGPNVDLAVLGYANNRIDLYRNTSSPGSLSFSSTPTLVSPWSGVSAMALFPADASVGQDLVLLNATPPRLDVLSGTGSTFRGLPAEPLSGPLSASGLAVADLRQDGLLDLLVLDNGPAGTATPLITDLTGVQTERPTVPAGNGPARAAVGPLTLHAGDYDQDGVLDGVDDCPTRYNPPGCPANDKIAFPECFVDIPCQDVLKAPLDCVMKDPVTQQCDSDLNGIGDQCQILDANCQNVDTDLDQVPDYDQFTTPKTLDNCPWTANSSQRDSDMACSISGAACQVDADCGATGGTCKGNGIGDVCDGSVCDLAGSSGLCHSGPKLNTVCRVDQDCEAPVNDALVVDQTGGGLAFLIGDASGSLRPAPVSWSAIGGLANPVAAVIGRFSYDVPCAGGIGGFPIRCNSNPEPGILVAERGAPGSGDDALKLFLGDGSGGFGPPVAPIAAQVPLQGDPTELLIAPDQNVCPNPWLLINDPRYHFDEDLSTSVVAAVEPGTSSLGIYLPSNEGPVPPPGNSNPLPLSSPPADAAFVDLNQDGYLDLLALSSGDGNPATPNITVYIGLGNGLFFTDPSLNPTDVPDGMTLLATGNVNLSTDSTYPDVVLYDGQNRTPVIMTNVLTERADIDRSGRVDGYDLAILTRAFGAERGEDFTIEPDGTLLQSPDLASSPAYDPTRLVEEDKKCSISGVACKGDPDCGAPGGMCLGVKKVGQDLPSVTGTAGVFTCDGALQPLSGLYGIPVDINLDGKVEGEDLAILASQFGKTY